MTTYTLDNAHQWLADAQTGLRQAAVRGLLSAAVRTVSHIQNEIIPALAPTPVARGVFRAGWHAIPLPNGAQVVNTVPHAGFIEYGVRAANVKIGRAMIAALTEWVRMKGMAGTLEDANRIAWAVAKSMQKNGIFFGRGLGVLKKARESIPQFVREEVERELRKEFGSG